MSKSNVAVSVLSAATVKALSDWSGKRIAARKGLVAVVDALVADGVVADDLVAVKGAKEDTPTIKAVKSAIVAGWTTAVQQLLLKDTKTLSDAKKAYKRYWQQQIGSSLKDVRNALTKRAETGASGQRTLKQLIHAEVTKRIAQVQEDTAPNYDAVELLKVMAIVAKLTKA